MKKALVVDDELDICLMISQYLQKRGFETHYALTVSEAHHKIHKQAYNLALIDLNLTDGSGYDVIRYLRERHGLFTKIIVITAYNNERDLAINLGADIFLSKPLAVKLIDQSIATLKL
jgi:DNA-binding response OmpR family regulator